MHEDFTLVCLLIRGNQPYTSDYVAKLQSMVRRHTTKPFKTVCLTDGSFDLPPDVMPIIITPSPGRAWWSKLQMFRLCMPFTGRVLYLDLDVLVVGGLDEIIDYPADFAIAPCSAVGWKGRGAKRAVKRYNSSVMVFDAGSRPQFFSNFTIEDTRILWGDQDLLGRMSPNEKTFPPEWTVRLSQGNPDTWHAETKIVLSIHEKPHVAVTKYPWFAEYWR